MAVLYWAVADTAPKAARCDCTNLYSHWQCLRFHPLHILAHTWYCWSVSFKPSRCAHAFVYPGTLPHSRCLRSFKMMVQIDQHEYYCLYQIFICQPYVNSHISGKPWVVQAWGSRKQIHRAIFSQETYFTDTERDFLGGPVAKIPCFWDKCSGLVHWEDPEESGGEGGGRGDRDGEYM